MGAVVDQAEKNDMAVRQPVLDLAVACAEQRRDRFGVQDDGSLLAVLDIEDEALRAPDRHEKTVAIDDPGANPVGLAAAQPGPLKAWMRIEIRFPHPRRLTCAGRRRNRAALCALHKAGLNGDSHATSLFIVRRTIS